MAQAAQGEPTKFITLTINPRVGDSPEDRLSRLAWAWRCAVKRLRRLYGKHAVQYLCVAEATKAGEPHLHILARAPYIPQTVLSKIMTELVESPIVDIRSIKSRRQVVAYVAKYISKQPHQFGSSKRYWTSQEYAPNDPPPATAADPLMSSWSLFAGPLRWLLEIWLMQGYNPVDSPDDFYAAVWHPPQEHER